ncbi:hypothetical protein NQZ68_001579 [Dissostichus eleginoides]|nr:hypothetical protein NQZ68_001579 [Dissostichus eleginoides]
MEQKRWGEDTELTSRSNSVKDAESPAVLSADALCMRSDQQRESRATMSSNLPHLVREAIVSCLAAKRSPQDHAGSHGLCLNPLSPPRRSSS